MERLRTPWSALERPGTFWNALERLGTPWNTLVWNHKAQKLNPPSSGNRFSRTLEYATSTFPFMAARKFEPSTRNCQKARGGFEKNQTFFPKCSMMFDDIALEMQFPRKSSRGLGHRVRALRPQRRIFSEPLIKDIRPPRKFARFRPQGSSFAAPGAHFFQTLN